jgi:hypothetical protein
MLLPLFLFAQAGRLSGGSKYSRPYDSTVGVGAGFYWFAIAFLLFIVFGTLKAYWDDKHWTGKSYPLKGRKSFTKKENPPAESAPQHK